MTTLTLHPRPNAAVLSASREILSSWLSDDRIYVGSHFPERPDIYDAVVRQRCVAGPVDFNGDGQEQWQVFVEAWASDSDTREGYAIAHDICLDIQTGFLDAVSIRVFTLDGVPGSWWIRAANRRAWTDMTSSPSEVHEYGMTLVLDLTIHNQEE